MHFDAIEKAHSFRFGLFSVITTPFILCQYQLKILPDKEISSFLISKNRF
jgi:hypothetical protein